MYIFERKFAQSSGGFNIENVRTLILYTRYTVTKK